MSFSLWTGRFVQQRLPAVLSTVTAGLESGGYNKNSGHPRQFNTTGINTYIDMFNRDCNGVSNGIDLPRQVLQLENGRGGVAGEALGADNTLYITNLPAGAAASPPGFNSNTGILFYFYFIVISCFFCHI